MRNCPACHMRSLLLLVLIALPRFEGSVIGNVRRNVIIGGKDIDISEAPHMVAILYRGNLRCGGSIIDEYTILTAAHCLSGIYRPDEISVRCGSTFFNRQGTVHVAEALKIHRKYDLTPYPDYDVGLIRVKEPIQFSKNAKPIALPAEKPETGTAVRIAGWGVTQASHEVAVPTRELFTNEENFFQTHESISEHLKSTEVDIVDWEKCNRVYKKLTPRMICAARPGKDSCRGDSGGGMDFNGTVVGIVSFGYHCADPNFPGVYTNVADPEILDFIKRRLN